MSNNIIIINGPNLNLLGEREQSQYGSITFDKLKENCLSKSKDLDINLEFCQSNIEGEIVTTIQEAKNKFDGIIINAGAYTHSSIAIRDALEIFQGAKIELHISNIFKREEFRHNSYLSSVVDALISGLGVDGYSIALLAINNILNKKKCQS